MVLQQRADRFLLLRIEIEMVGDAPQVIIHEPLWIGGRRESRASVPIGARRRSGVARHRALDQGHGNHARVETQRNCQQEIEELVRHALEPQSWPIR